MQVVKVFQICLLLSFLVGALYRADNFLELNKPVQQDSNDITVTAEMVYTASPETLFSAISDGTVFRLTGADNCNFKFSEGGQFRLDFKVKDGIPRFIEGEFKKIVPNKLVMISWNVTGFRAVPDKDTIVTFTITKQDDEHAKLEIMHQKIQTQESADGKSHGWNEILADLKPRLKN